MTVQDMDICLNISTERITPATRKNLSTARQSTSHSIERAKPPSAKLARNKNNKLRTVVNGQIAKRTRVKQPALSKIVATKLTETNKPGELQGILKKSSNFTKNPGNKTKKSVRINEKKEGNLNVKPVEQKQTDKTERKEQEKLEEPVISFTKLKKENIGKPLRAKKRNISETVPKKSLTEVFSNTQSIPILNVTTGTEKIQTDENDRPHKKIKPEESPEQQLKKKKKVGTKDKKVKDDTEENETQTRQRISGKISSLFSHNPEVPNIGQKLVKPINEPVFTAENFADLNIHPYTISNLEQNMEITKMTTVQRKAIPRIFSGKDILIRSQTGSGKTLAYALPIVELLHKIRPKLSRNSGMKALVVVPTRELALQTYECFLKLIKPFTWIVPGYLCGGEKRKAEKARLRKGCNILVGTPGRLLDHIKHTAALRLNEVKYFVLDEADRMFDMGYEKDISEIVSTLKIKSSVETSGYDPLELIRRNKKKVFTDEELGELENQNESQSSNNDKSQKNEVNVSKDTDSDDEDTTKDNRENIEYHSSSEDESETGEPYVKSKRTGRDATLVKKVEVPKEDNVTVGEEDTNDANRTGIQTILLSATLTQAVEKLAGLAMKDPLFVDAAKENVEATGGVITDVNEDFVVPQSVAQSYVVTPPKLRLVTLSAYIAGKCQSSGRHKVLVFMATQDMVDYYTQILSEVLTKPVDETDEDSDPLVDVEFFKLHGSMTQKERTNVFKTFREAKSGVLLCTDVAARGLDMPKVDCVIQYTGPLSARDYVHRIGRTARAGSSGVATIFLIPSEIEFVRMLESKRIRIKQEDMEEILGRLIGPLSVHNTPHSAAIALQNQFETLIIEKKHLRDKACKAYVSWVRFYASYPHEMRHIFDRKELHLGHFAKSFALRDPPQRIGGIGKNLREKDEGRKQHNNRLTNERPDRVPQKKQQRIQDAGAAKRTGLLKKVRMLNTSEYDSGLQPVRKPKKF